MHVCCSWLANIKFKKLICAASDSSSQYFSPVCDSHEIRKGLMRTILANTVLTEDARTESERHLNHTFSCCLVSYKDSWSLSIPCNDPLPPAEKLSSGSYNINVSQQSHRWFCQDWRVSVRLDVGLQRILPAVRQVFACLIFCSNQSRVSLCGPQGSAYLACRSSDCPILYMLIFWNHLCMH